MPNGFDELGILSIVIERFANLPNADPQGSIDDFGSQSERKSEKNRFVPRNRDWVGVSRTKGLNRRRARHEMPDAIRPPHEGLECSYRAWNMPFEYRRCPVTNFPIWAGWVG